MSNCIYCGQPAGFLRKQHPACHERYRLGWETLVAQAQGSLAGGVSLEGLGQDLDAVATAHLLPREHVRLALVCAYEAVVEQYLEDGLLTKDEESRLAEFQSRFDLSQSELDRAGAFMRVAKAAVLRDLMQGVIRDRLVVSGRLPFNLQKSERLVWVFPVVRYYLERTKTHIEGGSSGINVRIAKGVHYRVGAFKGNPVQTTSMSLEDIGMLGATTKGVVFAGERKAFRVAHNKIASLVQYSDGIGVLKDSQTARPIVFVTGDGWFSYNLLATLAQMASQ